MSIPHKRTPAERRILGAIRSSPYEKSVDRAAIEEADRDGSPLTPEQIAPYMESLGKFLIQLRRDEIANEKELSLLRSDLQASGRVFRAMGLRVAR